MGGLNAPVPCLLDDQGGGFYKAKSGDLKLVLQNQVGGTTNFVCGTCTVWDYTTAVHSVVTTGVTCSATSFEFKIPAPPAGSSKVYRIQLTFAQVPAYGASADLAEAACGQVLLSINPARLVLQWQVTVTA
jgi:hypothetical protein